ncbi:Colanic acid biosynthesis glycosyl transferase WcaL [uncultured Candidatus Thioglobus sp.]|nr:Colanic acid biosynthesis glycosyl transferase WcaL [uncultured Candidatus Thioglobus sp.]
MGGAEKVVMDLALYSNKEEFNTYVLALSKRDELLDDFLENNISTNILNKSNSLIDFMVIIREVNRFIKTNNIDIIHAHMTHPIIVASIIKLFKPSIKIVYTSHSIDIGSKIREIIVWALKPLREIDIIFSKGIIKFFYKKNHKIIPNGVKISKYNLKINKNKKFTFVSIGRLEVVKNHKILIEIAARLKGEFDFELHIAGDGYLKENLEKLIDRYKINDCVKLLGNIKDIPTLLNKSHCLVLPSLWEGMPIVILEAGASSLPVISTPVGSIPSLLNDQNSYISELKLFESSMIRVLEDAEESQKKGLILFDLIKKKYNINKVVARHEVIYKML